MAGPARPTPRSPTATSPAARERDETGVAARRSRSTGKGWGQGGRGTRVPVGGHGSLGRPWGKGRPQGAGSLPYHGGEAAQFAETAGRGRRSSGPRGAQPARAATAP